MLLQSGDRWHCTNPACRCELLVERTLEISAELVHCACGDVMKKLYSPPIFRYLDFIGHRQTQAAADPEPVLQLHASRKD
jgi:hypothetical protein